MARAPRRRTTTEDFELDAVDTAVEMDREGTANDLATVLDSLAGITGRDLKILVYRIPKGIGKWEYCTEIQPPFETSELMDMLKENYGAGDYAMRVMVEGKIKTTRNFSIAADRKLSVARAEEGGLKEVLPLLLAQMNGSKTDMMTMMQMQMQQSAQMQQAQQAAQAQSTQMMLGLVTAMMGNREKPGELIAAFAPLMAPKSGGFGEMVEIIKAVKEMSGNGGGGDSDGDMIKTVMQGAGMVLPAITEALASRRQVQQEQVHVVHQPPPPPAGHPGGPAGHPGGPAIEHHQGKFPILAAIREDVLFYFRRQADPDFAAEGVFDVLDKAGVGEDHFAPIIAAFLASPNWLDDLAAEGIDLRSNPEWAQKFLNGVIALYSEAHDDSAGGEGRASDAGSDGATGAPGERAIADPQ